MMGRSSRQPTRFKTRLKYLFWSST